MGKKNNKLKVVELFAGVGGFRLGLEKSNYEIVWSNQWEPSTKVQHASMVYENQFGNKNHSNEDIEKVVENNFDSIPDHDMLVGGFPCQDYSVATTLKNSKGLKGKKGVLWWSIYSILAQKASKKPKYLFLENVDRLLVSPSTQRGRDFAVILSCLNEQGYAVEWRVVNAGEYSMPQKRKRIYILAYHKSTDLYKRISNSNPQSWILKDGIYANSFPVKEKYLLSSTGTIDSEPSEVSNNFNAGIKKSPFYNSGVFIDGEFTSLKTEAVTSPLLPLRDIVLDTSEIAEEYFISETNKLKSPITKEQMDRDTIYLKTELDMWKYLKGRKKELKTNKTEGYTYKYAEGSMTFPDDLDKPSRTIITGEGGKAPSRFKHVILQDNKYRRLTPLELERLNMFPDNHTKLDGISDTKRAFFMGNALVVGVIEKVAKELHKHIDA